MSLLNVGGKLGGVQIVLARPAGGIASDSIDRGPGLVFSYWGVDIPRPRAGSRPPPSCPAVGRVLLRSGPEPSPNMTFGRRQVPIRAAFPAL